MKRQFRSAKPHRVNLLRQLAPGTLNGIDYLEVMSADQRSLRVVFVHPLSGITKANCRISGGVRISGIEIDSLSISGRNLNLKVSQAGDFSWYQFELIDPAQPDNVPSQFDPCLSSIRFSFKAQCPSEFDCGETHQCPPAQFDEPLLDYLSKDYASFRRLMLDRMGQLIPGFRERNPADFSVALVEMLAHIGDQLSYQQDAVATEAYLGTARRRVSLRRHARLLDYPIHEGCNSRVYVHLNVKPGADGQVLQRQAVLLTRGSEVGPVLKADILERLPDGETQVFESLHDLPLHAAHNRIRIHNWGDPGFCLGRGEVQAALVDSPALSLSAGALLIFEEVLGPPDPDSGESTEVNLRHRHAVRLLAVEPGHDPLTNTDLQLVRWHVEDALPFPLCVSAEFKLGGDTEVREIAVARGNVLLADHGQTLRHQPLVPAQVGSGSYRPRLLEPGVAQAEAYDHEDALVWSAARSLRQDPRRALPAGFALLEDDAAPGTTPWTAQRDLLGSDRFSRDLVLESEADGLVYLRFGDNRYGRQPEPQSRLLATYRIGGGAAGNVGAQSITRLVCENVAIAPFVESLNNPLAAQGGADAESAAAIKLYAPEAFRSQERAVTEADYARVAELHPQVQRAAARLRWTGSWYSMYISLDRKGGLALDADFRAEMLLHLERYRLAGYDLDLSEPTYAPLDIELEVCVLPGYLAAAVKRALLERLGSGIDELGRSGFFHPDHFSFGEALALSRLIEAVQAVTGVASLKVVRFQRWGKVANQELQDGQVRVGPLEVLRLDNDPNFPENGRLQLSMCGGL
ncbi:putative baseplate assembly protein [Pseudomonas alcaligenes]|uniref:Baseplate assembly protein n=1 Tax=Aquipseudomonas alcaligenes TaxID=43263 RepID=A0ABR7S4L1_AQUAC|nr:baseplate J/gp47 family protein [Pseudomonas alcaligenes]MBC9251672.1 putative baseplate assembly protein [Pseudomonas alcaligenes]